VSLSEEDAVAEEGEACSSVHLACDSFGLGVDAFGGAVAVGEREGGVHGVAVPFQTSGEGHAVTSGLPDRFQCGGKLAFGCGLRQGEVLGIAVEDIDFKQRLVRVNRQIKLVRSTMVFSLPKGERVRTVPMPDELARALKAHMKTYPPKGITLPWAKPDGAERTFRLLFTTDQGKAYHRSVLNEGDWKPALVSAGVIPPREKGAPRFAAAPEDGMHALRHAYASVLLDAGETIKALAEYLGHSDPGFTLRTYTHLMPASESRTRRAIDAAFASGGTEGAGEGESATVCTACALAA
jgi:integrase